MQQHHESLGCLGATPRSAADHSLHSPSPRIIAAALRATTERLAHELSQPQQQAPPWSEFEWRVARAVAAMHGISGVLATALRWQGAVGWRDFLDTQREHIAHRHLRVQRLLELIDERLRTESVASLVMKGPALIAEGLYEPGERPMGDADLLVAPDHMDRVTRILALLGFHEVSHTIKHRVFSPRQSHLPVAFGEDADNDLKVELHERVVEPLPMHLTDITRYVFPHDARAGLRTYPSTAVLMGHLLLHAAGDIVFRSLRMIQLHDIALLARRLTPAGWQEIMAWDPWWAFPPLALAERYYGAIAPASILLGAHKRCPLILRRVSARQLLSDVSLSRLWVEAFPGLAWARSSREAASYIAHRLVPSAELRSARQLQLKSRPDLAEGEWGRLTQGRRILRFLTTRPPRPAPMHNVRAALAQPR